RVALLAGFIARAGASLQIAAFARHCRPVADRAADVVRRADDAAIKPGQALVVGAAIALGAIGRAVPLSEGLALEPRLTVLGAIDAARLSAGTFAGGA